MVKVLLVISLFMFSVCGTLFAQEKAPPAPAQKPAGEEAAAPVPQKSRIEKIEGDCEYRASEEAEWVQAKEGQEVDAGGSLCTGFDSKVIVRFAGSSILEVASLTEVQIATFYTAKEELEARLKVTVGSVRVRVERGDIESDFQVSTPHTTTSVKGTDWEVITSYYGDEIKVYENAIKAANKLGRTASVSEGDRTNDGLQSNAEIEREETVEPSVPIGQTEEEVKLSTVDPASQDQGPSEQTSSKNPDAERQVVHPESTSIP